MSSRNPARIRSHQRNRNRAHLATPRSSSRPRRAWKLSSLLFCILAGISLSIVFLQKNVYRSEASVFVKLGRESVALDPTVTTTSTVALNETREGEINSIVEVLRSRTIAERMVDEFSAETILSGFMPGAESEKESWLGQTLGSLIDSARRFNDGRDVSMRERATRRLVKNLSISIPKKSTVLLLQYETQSPELAQSVLARLLEVFQEEHGRINRVTGTYDFLSSQNDILERRLEAAREELRNEKNRLKLVSIEGARQKLQDEYALLSKQLIESNTDLVAVNAKIESLQRELTVLPDRLPSENVSGLPNEATDRMRESLYQLEIRERDLLARYTEDHPLVQQVRKLVAEAESVYQEQGQQREQKTTAIHPSKQQLELIFLTEKSMSVSLTSRILELRRQIQDVQQEMVALTEGEIRIANLQREVEMADGSLRNYNDRLEQARLDQELLSEKISNLNVIQPASYMEKPVGLPRLILLVACLMLAFMGSVGVLLIPELRRWFTPPEEFADRQFNAAPSTDFSYQESREPREPRESRDSRDSRESRESRESRSANSHLFDAELLEPVADESP